jgi:hypothetical protein
VGQSITVATVASTQVATVAPTQVVEKPVATVAPTQVVEKPVATVAPTQVVEKPAATAVPPTVAPTEKPTATPKPPTATPTEKPTATPKPPTATATPAPTAVPPPSKAQAAYLDPRILAAEPKAHIGESIYLQGKTLTVDQNNDHTWVQILAQVSGKDSVYESIVVEMRPKQTRLLRAECYRIYGIVKGTTKVTRTATGAENEVPLVSGYDFEAVPAGQYGGCANP